MKRARVGVLAFDPGGTTGWAHASVYRKWLLAGGGWGEGDAGMKLSFGQITGREPQQANEIVGLISSNCLYGQSALVTERFTLRSSVRTRELLAPVRLNACLEWWCWQNEVNVFQQDPALAMSRWTDERLKRADLFTARFKKHGGGPHALDATRHALTFLSRVAADPQLLALTKWGTAS